jgi:YggT family protein
MDIVLVPLLRLVISVISLLHWFVIIHVILNLLISFKVIDGYGKFTYNIQSFLYKVTSPFLMPIQRILPSFGGFDLSPVVLLLALGFLQDVLYRLSNKFIS